MTKTDVPLYSFLHFPYLKEMTEKSDLTELELYESERLLNELNEREEQYERMSFDEKEEDEYEYEYEQLQYERIALLEQNEEDDSRYH